VCRRVEDARAPRLRYETYGDGIRGDKRLPHGWGRGNGYQRIRVAVMMVAELESWRQGVDLRRQRSKGSTESERDMEYTERGGDGNEPKAGGPEAQSSQATTEMIQMGSRTDAHAGTNAIQVKWEPEPDQTRVQTGKRVVGRFRADSSRRESGSLTRSRRCEDSCCCSDSQATAWKTHAARGDDSVAAAVSTNARVHR